MSKEKTENEQMLLDAYHSARTVAKDKLLSPETVNLVGAVALGTAAASLATQSKGK